MSAVEKDIQDIPKDEPTPYQRYKQLWGQTQRLNEDNPDHLVQKLTLYGQLYEWTGKFLASARSDARLAKLERQEQEARVFLKTPKGKDGYTEKEREKKAFLAAKLLIKREIEYENEADRWANARDSILEQINIMKRKQDVQINIFQRGNSLNG
jgi:hypothetical protein